MSAQVRGSGIMNILDSFCASALVMSLVVFLAACTAGQQVAMESDAEVRAEAAPTLCTSLAYFSNPDFRAIEELLRRGAIREKYVYGIRERQVLVGMNGCEMHAAIGLPVKVNRTTTAAGTRLQLVYEGGRFVYMDEGGFVTVVQDF
jgi:hypothetical protein